MKSGGGFLRRDLSKVVVLVMIAGVVLGAGCGEARVETRRWKPPSGASRSGTLNPRARTGASGSFLAYTAETNGGQPYRYKKIFVVPTDEGRRYPQPEGSAQRLTEGPWDDYPSVSPDGDTIIYEHSERDASDAWGVTGNRDGGVSTEDVVPSSVGIFAVSSRGGASRQVTPASWMTGAGWSPLVESKPGTVGVTRYCTSPSFSPDGKRICFVIRDMAFPGRESRTALATMPADGSSEPEIIYLSLGSGDSVSCPKYSPDGKWIYFCCGGGIKREPAEGGRVSWVIRPHEVESSGGASVLPSAISFSLQGFLCYEGDESEDSNEVEYMAFDFAREQPGLYAVTLWGGVRKGWHIQIELMGMKGEDPQPIYGGSGSIRVRPDRISVSPDGRRIAFSSGDFGWGDQGPIYTLDLKDLRARVIADGDHPCFGLWPARAPK